jgi:hypothetical protein
MTNLRLKAYFDNALTPQGPPLILNRILTHDMERSAKNTHAVISQLRKLGLTEDQGKKVLDALRIAKT